MKQIQSDSKTYSSQSHWRKSLNALMQLSGKMEEPAEMNIGRRLKELRTAQGLSIRALADICGLNFNTLCLIENGKTSPNVNTLQQIAIALHIPITAFFEAVKTPKEVIFQKSNDRVKTSSLCGELEDLGGGMALGEATPLLLSAGPDSASGPDVIVHTGQEFVFCLEGSLAYTVGDEEFTLEQGDSLIFQAHIPHRWENRSNKICRFLLIICPSDYGDRSVDQHLAQPES